jgi:mRNA-degrading endonuclease YafQ of YafQ-DinJ toxin-antitoxin module
VAYELESIESQISKNIQVAASENIELDVPMFLEELDVECFKVKRAFRHQVVSFENERLIKRYFHFHQESLIDLINTLHTERQLNASFLHSVLDRLAGLLRYLEEHFPEYFNQDLKMPVIYEQLIKNEVEEFNGLLSRKFTDTKSDPVLIGLLKNGFEAYIKANVCLTFRQFYYLKLLRLNIEGLHAGSEFETIDLVRVMLHCNFNTEAFYEYVLKYVRGEIDKAVSIGEKLDQLSYYLKFVNQESSNQAIAFNHLQPAISILISEWLTQELTYLKSKQQFLSTVTAEEIVPSIGAASGLPIQGVYRNRCYSE